MTKAVDSFREEANRLCSGPVEVGAVEAIRLKAYGSQVRMSHIATVRREGRSLVVSVWDPELVPAVANAMAGAGLGLSPVPAGQDVRSAIKPLDRERSQAVVRKLSAQAELARVSVRHARRKALKSGADPREVQAATDSAVGAIDKLLAAAKAEISGRKASSLRDLLR
jgi:ribosome recycling factor